MRHFRLVGSFTTMSIAVLSASVATSAPAAVPTGSATDADNWEWGIRPAGGGPATGTV